MSKGNIGQVIGTVVDVEFPPDKLPNIYTAFMYFRKNNELIWEVAKLTQLIMENWEDFYLKYLE